MRTSAVLAPLFFAATSLAQAVEEGIAPSSPPPSGCQSNANGNFTIGTLKVGHHNSKRESAVEAADSALVCYLKDGVLRDRDGRTGSVVANHQFQFDGPPQAGAIYTGGFSICSNGSLAIGGTTQWWQCSSGPFYNLYDEWIGAQCEEIRIQVTFPKTMSSASVSAASSSVPVASVVSSLATISGAVSTVSKSAIGPSASFASSNASGASSNRASATASVSRGAASASPSSTAAPAPPANAADASFGIAKGSMLGAFVVIFGAALIL